MPKTVAVVAVSVAAHIVRQYTRRIGIASRKRNSEALLAYVEHQRCQHDDVKSGPQLRPFAWKHNSGLHVYPQLASVSPNQTSRCD